LVQDARDIDVIGAYKGGYTMILPSLVRGRAVAAERLLRTAQGATPMAKRARSRTPPGVWLGDLPARRSTTDALFAPPSAAVEAAA
jgi:hypothetical protein